jgi:hypothetical protein
MSNVLGPGDKIVPGAGAAFLAFLEARRGIPTIVHLADGQQLTVHNTAWGRDMGDKWEHVTTNCSPFVVGAPVDFFLTSHVVSATDPDTRRVLFEQAPRPEET